MVGKYVHKIYLPLLQQANASLWAGRGVVDGQGRVMADVTSHSSIVSSWGWLIGVGSDTGCIECAALIWSMCLRNTRKGPL